MPRLERDVLHEVLIEVTALPGSFFVRTNTGAATVLDRDTGATRFVRFNRKGAPDIIGCLRGTYVGIECKRDGRSVQSPDQRRFQENVERAGGVYVVVRSAFEAIEALGRLVT